MSALFDGKRILITGGTGSLGQVLARRLMTGDEGVPESVTVFSRDEAKQHYMRLDFMHGAAPPTRSSSRTRRERLKFMIGDVRDYASVARAARREPTSSSARRRSSRSRPASTSPGRPSAPTSTAPRTSCAPSPSSTSRSRPSSASPPTRPASPSTSWA